MYENWDDVTCWVLTKKMAQKLIERLLHNRPRTGVTTSRFSSAVVSILALIGRLFFSYQRIIVSASPVSPSLTQAGRPLSRFDHIGLLLFALGRLQTSSREINRGANFQRRFFPSGLGPSLADVAYASVNSIPLSLAT